MNASNSREKTEKELARSKASKEKLNQDIEKGLKPFLVIASAGTTDTGAIDPLEDISVVAAENKLWAKSGGMKRVRSYTGFARSKSGKLLSFSIIANHFSFSLVKSKYQPLILKKVKFIKIIYNIFNICLKVLHSLPIV